MGANRLEVSCCKECPFAPDVLDDESFLCRDAAMYGYELRVTREIYDGESSPEECGLGEILIVKSRRT